MNPNIYLSIAGLGVLTIGAAGVLMKNWGERGETPSSTPTEANGPEKITLAQASNNWVGTVEVITLAEAAQNWVEDTTTDTKDVPNPVYEHADINRFYSDCIDKKIPRGNRRIVIEAILQLLDKHGDCPSVVRNPSIADVNNGYDENTFTILARIPLYAHTLNVARAMAKRVGQDYLVPDSIIVALGHDLGKMPQWHERGYRTGDHPKISTMALDGIHEYSKLPNHTELSTIIMEHHLINPSNPLTALLKECDGITRNKELSAQINQSIKDQQAAQPTAEVAIEAQQPVQHNKDTVPWEPPANIASTQKLPQVQKDPAQQQAHPLGNDAGKGKSTYVPRRIDIPWFNPEAFLETIKPFINVVHEKRWGAVSMPTGIVYVNSECLWKTLKKIAPEEIKPVLQVADADAATQRNYLYSAVWTLSEKKNAIVADMIHPNYYMIPVSLIDGSGKLINQGDNKSWLLTPFKAEAFGMLASELESTKTPAIHRMIKTIKPKMGDQS